MPCLYCTILLKSCLLWCLCGTTAQLRQQWMHCPSPCTLPLVRDIFWLVRQRKCSQIKKQCTALSSNWTFYLVAAFTKWSSVTLSQTYNSKPHFCAWMKCLEHNRKGYKTQCWSTWVAYKNSPYFIAASSSLKEDLEKMSVSKTLETYSQSEYKWQGKMDSWHD